MIPFITYILIFSAVFAALVLGWYCTPFDAPAKPGEARR